MTTKSQQMLPFLKYALEELKQNYYREVWGKRPLHICSRFFLLKSCGVLDKELYNALCDLVHAQLAGQTCVEDFLYVEGRFDSSTSDEVKYKVSNSYRILLLNSLIETLKKEST